MDRSPFNKLSAELRNNIYELAVTEAKPIEIKKTRKGRCIQPAITRVCRQIRQESLLLFYSCNKFSLKLAVYNAYEGGVSSKRDFSKVAWRWLAKIPGEHHKAILHLEITTKMWWSEMQDCLYGNGGRWALLAKFLKLRKYDRDRLAVKIEIVDDISFGQYSLTGECMTMEQLAADKFGLEATLWAKPPVRRSRGP